LRPPLRPFRSLPLLLAALLLAPAAAWATGVGAAFSAPLVPPSTGGIELIDRALAKLSADRRLLVIGAHPDDEDTTLLALVARGMGGEAGYLSLSRGEGGQNLIGPELGVGLGLIRSRELLAARGVDGARQFFSRAFDFGYTRSLPETLRFWPEPVLLEDAVRVIRRFKPQVLVAVFPPDERAGHGQHQASGLIATEAYAKAGEAGAFPELAAAGLPPWRPQAFYRAAWWDPSQATVSYSLSPLDPIDGRSVFQLAMASRSQHRSQDMGMLQPLGPKEGRLAWVDGGAGHDGDGIFAGIDTHLAAITAPLADDGAEGLAKRQLQTILADVEARARRERLDLSPVAPGAALPSAVAIAGELEAARVALAGAPTGPAARIVADLLDEKRVVAAHLLAAAAGIAVDAVADRELVTPGEEITVETTLWRAAGGGGGAAAGGEQAGAGRLPAGPGTAAFAPPPAVELAKVELVSPTGLTPAVAETPVPERTGFEARFFGQPQPEAGYHLSDFHVTFPPGTPPTVPYFLRKPLHGDVYDWSGAPPEVRGEPFGPPPLVARFHLAVPGDGSGFEVVLDREVVYRTRDQAVGEVRRPLRVVPALEVALAPDLVVWPVAATEPRELEVTLTSHAGRPLAGSVETAVPAGWPAVAPVAFRLGERGDRQSVRVPVRPPSNFAAGSFAIEVAAVLPGGERYALAVPVVDYPHIRPTPLPEPATSRVSAFELALPPLSRVGYVRGASDRVPEFLREVGVPIELLGPAALAGADLSAFDAIVVGSRAYETDPALAEANKRLLDYARSGGLVIVQYQQYPFIDGGFAPFPLTIDRPHDRVTDETAPVAPIDPADPVLTTPNRIGAADWEGWVQERGLYFAHTWDPAYRPLLAMADPGGPELRGGLLVARLGEGTYVYTGLAFFRQLPAGVPGAYRLFANLLALAGR
jgi:LmbE family N-acetylglucosaminyl deacetylase